MIRFAAQNDLFQENSSLYITLSRSEFITKVSSRPKNRESLIKHRFEDEQEEDACKISVRVNTLCSIWKSYKVKRIVTKRRF